MTNCTSLSFDFPACRKRRVEADFSGGDITSNGGVLLLRQAHGVMKLQHNKTDANDAVLLAEIARTGFCRPVSVNSEDAQKHRMLIKARRLLVCQRRDIQNAVRGFLCALGIRFPKGSGKLGERVQTALMERPDLAPMIEPLLASVKAHEMQIKHLDQEVLEVVPENRTVS